jgi:4-hydroxybenzoate polyprenyltransferase
MYFVEVDETFAVVVFIVLTLAVMKTNDIYDEKKDV